MKFGILYSQIGNLELDDSCHFLRESVFDSNNNENEMKYTNVKYKYKNSNILNEMMVEDNLVRGGSLVVPNWMNSMIYMENNSTPNDLNNECENMNNDLDFNTKDSCNSGSCDLNNMTRRPRHFSCFICNKYKARSTKARFKVCKHVCCYHCLRKALQIEYWGAKKDVWERCRAVCPFCHVFLDWSKIKPFILLTPEAKEYPLMALCENDERVGEAYRVLNSFFPKGVPHEVIFGQNIDFSIRPKVTQILFGYNVGLSNIINDYSNNNLDKNENNSGNVAVCSQIFKFDSDLELFEEGGMCDITTTEGEDDVKDGSDSSYYSDTDYSTTMRIYIGKNWDKIVENDNYSSLYCYSDNNSELDSLVNSGPCDIYPDIFSSWRNNEFVSTSKL
ncbi:hypothetical protein FG379_000061 [Cryptosporidium bovis]|uniref:uncharacterized protein n=1 Tax=Cryptosporidium bovis TaxID=310047 RepID=UPI00351A42B6|nr:hypothetical protein FG379_000061 [Cryptosporidium bovis]